MRVTILLMHPPTHRLQHLIRTAFFPSTQPNSTHPPTHPPTHLLRIVSKLRAEVLGTQALSIVIQHKDSSDCRHERLYEEGR